MSTEDGLRQIDDLFAQIRAIRAGKEISRNEIRSRARKAQHEALRDNERAVEALWAEYEDAIQAAYAKQLAELRDIQHELEKE